MIDETEDFENPDRAKLAADLLCQGCKKNKAFFMCAGCSQQWYCSKDCQVRVAASGSVFQAKVCLFRLGTCLG